MKDFAEVATPLNALMEKYVRHQWNDECQVAFERLKAALTSSPILAMPTDGDVDVLNTDASEQSFGAVLFQKQGGEKKVIAYSSRTYSKAEQNYCTTRKELLAVVYFMKQFRQYLLGNRFFCPNRSRLNVVTEGDQLDGPTTALA